MFRGMRFGLCTDQNLPFATLVERWQLFERLGFDSVWDCDHFNQPSRPSGPYYEGWTVLAALAARITRIRVGVLVSCNTFRHPGLLAHQATHDPLTGLANRSRLLEVLAEARRRARADDGTFGVLFVDLDEFKLVNDEHGHDIGDLVLQLVAKRISGCIRRSDTAIRVGGDEFVVSCPGADLDEANALARRITSVLGAPFLVAHLGIRVGASVGVALGTGASSDLADVVRQADQAMYRHKDRPRDDEGTVAP